MHAIDTRHSQRGATFNTSFKSDTSRAAPADAAKGQQAQTTGTKAGAAASSAPSKPGSAYPEVRTSNIDVNATPIYEPAGKPITELDVDAGKNLFFKQGK